ncbi:oxidoreductase [Mesorhizobium sp. L-8-10]|uniref:xanthine dehydrogenase family protein molybdopterin-binding subunit n=1 Tax=Mesorhizobium sp. L-8-10 TaxID=2744523 RepID=UPI0019261454|nr:xanthine dehydrogenase family protein molybdopterin-binding subunit [Mesorhizobium sp. L-8-10]BCH29329.1 oxidoreductase [Mesorhizobium sp. L-8-10]
MAIHSQYGRTQPLSRRTFLKSTAAVAGAFVLGTYLPLDHRATAQVPQGPFDPNVFLRITPDNIVTLLSKKFEMGQGVTTGIATLVADELDADWSLMRIEYAPNNPALYNNLVFGPVMATGGSTSMLETWTQMRQVGAATRAMFVKAAAAKWGVAENDIEVAASVVRTRDGAHEATLGDLAGEAMGQPVPETVTLKQPEDWKLIGKRAPRLDSVAKTTGAAMFALDTKRDGELIAMVKRPSQFGATVASFDDAGARAVAGVVEVVQIPQGVAVLANDTWSAMRGRDALKVVWDASQAETRSTAQILESYRQMLSSPGLAAANRGDSEAALSRAVRTIEAEFTFPFLAHAPMEPLNCTLELKPDGAELWSGCQLQSIDQFALMSVLGLQPEQVTIHTLPGGGSFGRRGNPLADWTREVAAIAKAIGGRAPVHLVWTREDDIKGGFYRPLVLHKVKAGLDADGRLSGWQHSLVSQSIFTGTPFEAMAVHDGIDHSSVEGVVDSAYAIADFDLQLYNATSPVPVLWWRSVGHSHTAHVMETMVDELAEVAGKDPVQFRLDMLADKPRDVAVLKLAAGLSGWGEAMPSGKGRGVAYHFSFGTRVAYVADVTVEGGSWSVDRIVAAVDCGVAVNPDVVTAQIEGAIGFALSSLMRNAITLDNGRVVESNFDDYEPTRIREMPKVEVHIVPSNEWPSGIGEPGVPPLAPAIGNAIAAVTGRRLRSLPFDVGAAG